MASAPRRGRPVLEPVQPSRPPAIPAHRPAAQKGQATRAARLRLRKKAPPSRAVAALLEERIRALEGETAALWAAVDELRKETSPHR